MAASVQYRQQENSFVMKEKDDDLALFLEMRDIEDDRENHFLLRNSDGFDDSLGSEPDNSAISKMASTMASDKPPANGFLDSDEKSNYNWLLTPPDTPLFPSLEMESQKTAVSQIPISNGHSTAPKSKLENQLVEPTTKIDVKSRRSASSTRRPTSNTSRSSTPTARPNLLSTTKPSRASTPTLRSTLPSTKPTAPQKRSSTPTRPITRSSTPSARPSILTATKSASRSSTPTRKLSAPSSLKSGATNVKNPAPSRGTSPTVKPRPQKDDGPSSLRTPVTQRPVSASKGRPSATSAQSSSSSNNSSNGRQRRQSCFPSRVQAQNGSAYSNMRSLIAKSRGDGNGSDDVNPVLMGTQMVERVVNMRKLAPPKQDDSLSNHNNSFGKSSSSQESSGFGRSLSKKSFDMALRHMDIRKSIPGNLCSLMTKVPASSVYSVRSGPTKSTTVSVSDSPLATSSTASSEVSFNNNHQCLDGSEVEDNDFGSGT